LHRLTCAALRRWPDWLPSCGLHHLADLQHLAEEAAWLGSQHSEEEAGLAGFAMAAENWTLQSPRCLPEGVLD
jgi:hypothetical protein